MQVVLPDESVRTLEAGATVAQLAADIGPGLARQALAGRVDGKLVDLSWPLHDGCRAEIVTARDQDGVDIIRHSTAHLMAQAVQRLYPDTKVTIGPVIENGFYYDFSREAPFTPEDFAAIESMMQTIVAEALPIERSVMSRDEALAFFREMGEHYKAEIIESIPANEELSLYRQGEFIDLCRGPHVDHTGRLGAFKLTKVAGAYWRGDHRNAMLQRIYGTAWPDKKALKAYLHQLEEAERRDHRRLGKQMDLWHMQEEAPGMVFWHPRGWALYQALQQYMREKQRRHGYQELNTPQVVDRVLWERSGHWDKYSDAMFTTASEHRDYAIKPMNCPCHVQVYNSGLKSYRDLPVRYAEFGSCHRNEMSGALHGLMRVRGFTQDDGHIFCTEAQMLDEALRFIDMLHEVYADLGFTDLVYKLSTRPEQRVGSDESWDRAEKALAEALDAKQLEWEVLPGEGAFYGPKLEVQLRDSIGRVWQCGTLQVDFNMPQRLDAEYVDEHSERCHPVMLHRAILGSFERFIGILIEEYEGKLPVWLAPVQAAVLTITERQNAFAENVAKQLGDMGFRVEADLRNEKVGFKIREHTLQRVPYLIVIGDREVEQQQVAVRSRDGTDLGSMDIDAAAKLLGADNPLIRH